MPEVTDTLGSIVSSSPGAAQVLTYHGLDFCCGGDRTLVAACTTSGLAPDAVIKDITDAAADAKTHLVDAAARPLAELIDYIVAHYHRRHREQLPWLFEMAQKVARVHRERDPERLVALPQVLGELQADLTSHMIKEERVLFPWITAQRRPAPSQPIAVMLAEHDAAGELLETIRSLTDNFELPAHACGTWTALWQGLEVLDAELREHIHLENNVLFPRALASLA